LASPLNDTCGTSCSIKNAQEHVLRHGLFLKVLQESRFVTMGFRPNYPVPVYWKTRAVLPAVSKHAECSKQVIADRLNSIGRETCPAANSQTALSAVSGCARASRRNFLYLRTSWSKSACGVVKEWNVSRKASLNSGSDCRGQKEAA
jgi:hypothetical protein